MKPKDACAPKGGCCNGPPFPQPGDIFARKFQIAEVHDTYVVDADGNTHPRAQVFFWGRKCGGDQ